MVLYRNILIGIGIFILIVVLILVLISLISNIDYKRQITGKRPMREFKGNVDYNGSESYNSDLEIDRATKDKLTRNEVSHRL